MSSLIQNSKSHHLKNAKSKEKLSGNIPNKVLTDASLKCLNKKTYSSVISEKRPLPNGTKAGKHFHVVNQSLTTETKAALELNKSVTKIQSIQKVQNCYRKSSGLVRIFSFAKLGRQNQDNTKIIFH